MSAHTQGPWRTPGNGCVVAADDTLVCPVPRPKGAGASVRRDANARLIAAAPELLEALKLVIAARELPDAEFLERIAKNAPLCRHIIAKAEGRNV